LVAQTGQQGFFAKCGYGDQTLSVPALHDLNALEKDKRGGRHILHNKGPSV